MGGHWGPDVPEECGPGSRKPFSAERQARGPADHGIDPRWVHLAALSDSGWSAHLQRHRAHVATTGSRRSSRRRGRGVASHASRMLDGCRLSVSGTARSISVAVDREAASVVLKRVAGHEQESGEEEPDEVRPAVRNRELDRERHHREDRRCRRDDLGGASARSLCRWDAGQARGLRVIGFRGQRRSGGRCRRGW